MEMRKGSLPFTFSKGKGQHSPVDSSVGDLDTRSIANVRSSLCFQVGLFASLLQFYVLLMQ